MRLAKLLQEPEPGEYCLLCRSGRVIIHISMLEAPRSRVQRNMFCSASCSISYPYKTMKGFIGFLFIRNIYLHSVETVKVYSTLWVT